MSQADTKNKSAVECALQKNIDDGLSSIGTSSGARKDRDVEAKEIKFPVKKVRAYKLGRKGDPRMHRAVAARVANRRLTLLEALLKGGFTFPNLVERNGMSDKHICDCNGVSLGQRKNQLSRRLRQFQKQHNVSSDIDSAHPKTSSTPKKQAAMGTPSTVITTTLEKYQAPDDPRPQALSEVNPGLADDAVLQFQQQTRNLLNQHMTLADNSTTTSGLLLNQDSSPHNVNIQNQGSNALGLSTASGNFPTAENQQVSASTGMNTNQLQMLLSQMRQPTTSSPTNAVRGSNPISETFPTLSSQINPVAAPTEEKVALAVDLFKSWRMELVTKSLLAVGLNPLDLSTRRAFEERLSPTHESDRTFGV